MSFNIESNPAAPPAAAPAPNVKIVNGWCLSIGFPQIVIVKSPNKTLEQDCLDRGQLPSIAYGFKTCSLRFKVEPQEKYLRQNGFKDFVKLIGIDAGEQHRAKEYKGTKYPLIEWDWDNIVTGKQIGRASGRERV